MAPQEILNRASNVRDLVSGRPRISVTDLSRSKDWRAQLPEAGVMEVTDRGDTAAWLLSDEDMRAILDGYTYLEEELERAQIAAMFKAREGSVAKSGAELEAAAMDVFAARKKELRSVIDGD
ncbi:hypothetical protein [Arabiibacter massiliensis]|uniref:hypothetical protein n=1 Tax=Arabiibacter massiliensis TaxID=1870985 RepID=UPI0009BA5BA9|nr:hypothetical protein [Arabiibacter massiliensis]